MANYRNPNGYGSVVKLSGRRRNPYAVRKTVGWDDRAYPIYSIIGYYPTRKDALIALGEYNHNPYDIEQSKLTMKEVYEAWSKETFPALKSAMKTSYTSAYKHCSSVYDKEYKTLRKAHMQACIDSSGKGYSTRSNIKMLFNQLDKYAFDHDIISKCYAKNLDIGSKEASEKHTLVNDTEVLDLWKHRGEPYVDETLFLLYTGCRVSEMLRLRTAAINFDDMTMTGGLKTGNGKNRTIPIHPDILPIVKDHYSAGNTYLFQAKENQDTNSYTNLFSIKWSEKMKALGFNHLTHDCRHTVRSKLDSAGANKVAIDRIMGHSSNSIGEKIYTHKTVEELHEAIKLLSYTSTNFQPLVTR